MVDNLPTREMRDEYIESFGLFDKHGEGYLTKHEFLNLMRSLDPSMGGEELEEFMEKTKLQNMKEIYIDPFTDAMRYKMRQPYPIDEITKAFSVFDPENEGRIGFDELKQAFVVIGEAFFTVEERNKFLEVVKTKCDKDGKVDYKKLTKEMFEKCLSTEDGELG